VQNTSGRLDTASIAGSAVFSALAILLAGASQALGLNFPLIPYLQFDVGEVAIILAFFIFGPVPALVSSAVEFAGLMVFGQAIPVGPLLKLFALISTVAGLWLGARIAARGGATLSKLTGWSTAMGCALRAALMTVPNFYLIVYLYGLTAIEGFLRAPFAAIGVPLTGSDVLVVVLAFTAVFNVIQLVMVMAVSYLVIRVPAVPRLRLAGRTPWFASMVNDGGVHQEKLADRAPSR
jgi:riboflavin transporter FmnP